MSRSCSLACAFRWVWLLVSLLLAPVIPAQEPKPAPGPADEQDDPLLEQALTPWSGDLDGILKRAMLRVAIPCGLSTYFTDGPEQRGWTYDDLLAFEQAANLTLVILPTNRARLLPMLTEGLADLAAGTITVTVTEGHRALVDFSDPFHTEVREVLVTGPAAAGVEKAEDLLASQVYLRPSTSFYEHLRALNAKRVAAGKAPFRIAAADENLADDDLLETVGTGIIPATIADEPVAKLFAQVFENIRVRDDLVLASDQHIAWVMRKDSPKLKALVNAYVAQARKRAAKLGLSANVRLDNVEIAAAKVVSREPLVYVRNNYKFYVADKLLNGGKVAAAAGN